MRNTKIVVRRFISFILVFVIIFTNINNIKFIEDVNADEGTINLYLIDKTPEQWIKNDSAVIQLVDNTNGHDYYDMTKVDDTTWVAEVPASAYNITFNRLNEDKSVQWNSWSAGGRDSNNAYCVDGAE